MMWLFLWTMAYATDEVESVFDDDVYRFCHEANLDGDEARKYCALLDDLPVEKCQGLRETCASDEESIPSLGGGCNQPNLREGGESIFTAPRRPEPPPNVSGCDLPETGLMGFLQAFAGAFVVGLLVLVLIRLAVWIIRSRRTESVVVQPAESSSVTIDFDEVLEGVPNLPTTDLLAAARQALSEGRFGDAVMLARGASLRHLGERQLLTLHRATTDREYLRAARNVDVDIDALRVLFTAVEQHKWGGVSLTEALAKQALAAAQGLVALCCLVWVQPASAQDLISRYGPDGDVALHDVFQRFGYDVRWRKNPLTELTTETSVLVLDLYWASPDETAWTAVEEWVANGGMLIVTGPMGAGVFTDSSVSTCSHEPPDCAELAKDDPACRPVTLKTPLTPDVPAPILLGALECGYSKPINKQWAWYSDGAGEQPVIAQWLHGDGVVVGVADGRLMLNGSLVHPDNESFWGEFIFELWSYNGLDMGSVELATAVSLASDEGQNPPSAVANARLLPLVIHLLILWLAFALWKGWPFGPPKEDKDRHRQDFADHIDALARQYQRAGDSRFALSTVARMWVNRLGPQGLHSAALRAGQTPDQASAWTAKIIEISETPEADSSSQDWKVLEELWSIMTKRS